MQVKKRAPQINSFRRDWICAQNLLTILESIIKMIQGGGGDLCGLLIAHCP